jgi:hypothetical protein
MPTPSQLLINLLTEIDVGAGAKKIERFVEEQAFSLSFSQSSCVPPVYLQERWRGRSQIIYEGESCESGSGSDEKHKPTRGLIQLLPKCCKQAANLTIRNFTRIALLSNLRNK